MYRPATIAYDAPAPRPLPERLPVDAYLRATLARPTAALDAYAALTRDCD